jgi:hypothetical protein
MLYQLNDIETGESCGLVEFIGMTNPNITLDNSDVNLNDDIWDSWVTFNTSDEQEDSTDVDIFVEWHNADRKTQFARVFVEIIQP